MYYPSSKNKGAFVFVKAKFRFSYDAAQSSLHVSTAYSRGDKNHENTNVNWTNVMFFLYFVY